MEVGVQIIGIFLRLLNFLFAPLFWLRARDQRRIPPLRQPLLLKSASDLADAIRLGEITSEELVSKYIARINEVNPFLNAVVEDRYTEALEEAREVDRKIVQAKYDGKFVELVKGRPLLGVPFTVKESCSLAGLSNSVGCLEHKGRRATVDGEAVRLVKQAGGIALLVSNTPELCLGWETTNLLNGTTNNPFCLNRTCGGSSGGEAALLSSGASALGVASDIAGSIRLPAAFCGVFGHKPTPGIISIASHIPTLNDENYSKFLTVGPMTRRADDLYLLMNVMAGSRSDALSLDVPVDIRNLKIYYMTEASKSMSLLEVQPCIVEGIKLASKYLERECGCQISAEKFMELEDSVEISISVFFSMKDIPNLMQDPANPKRDKSIFIELIKYACGKGSRSLQGLGFSVIDKTRLFIPDSKIEYYHNRANHLQEKIEKTLGNSGVLLYPVFNDVAHQHNQVFMRASGVMYTMVFNILGMPATTVPLGLSYKMPVCIQVIAGRNQDRLCLAVAKQLEKGFGGWRTPQ